MNNFGALLDYYIRTEVTVMILLNLTNRKLSIRRQNYCLGTRI